MQTNLLFTVVFIQLSKAWAELLFRRLMENQSLELSCSLQQNLGSPTRLHLYHRGGVRHQVTLLSVAEGSGEVRVSPEHRGRLQVRGGLHSLHVNVTVPRLELSDTGLYVWELSFREEDDSELIHSDTKVFLLVEGTGRPCPCSSTYPALLLTIFAATGLVVLLLCWLLATEKRLKVRHHRHHPRPKPSAPIYEEMTRKQQRALDPQNNHKAPSHLEEDHFPVYANANILHPQDNYYACPRQLALRA